MRQRLLAQQLGLASPTPGTQQDRGSPRTPQGTGSPSVRGRTGWRTEPRVRMMPSTPEPPSPWMLGRGPSTPTRGTPQTRTPKRWTPDRALATPPAPGTPLERSNLSAKDREKQLQAMLSSLVTVVEQVDMNKANVPGLLCRLLPHQVQGIEWMQQRECGDIKGGILADDMGLGKVRRRLTQTVQMLALILLHRTLESMQSSEPSDDLAANLAKEGLGKPKAKAKAPPTSGQDDPDGAVFVDEVGDMLAQRRKAVYASGTKTTLIIAPLAVVEQWQREANEKTGHKLQVYVHHGPHRAKSADVLRRADVVITTYATASNEHAQYLADLDEDAPSLGSKARPLTLDSDASSSASASSDSDTPLPRRTVRKPRAKVARAPLFQVKWLRVVLGRSLTDADEAHNIKNYRAKSSQACYELSLNAASRWCLTGTPLQNNVLELFSLMHFLRAAPFDDLSHFREKIDDPLKSTYVARLTQHARPQRKRNEAAVCHSTHHHAAAHQGRRIQWQEVAAAAEAQRRCGHARLCE